MIGNFIGKDIHSVGISFGINVIKDALKNKMEKNVAQFYLIPINTLEKSLSILTKLRQNNLKCDIDLNNKGISKNLEYASRYEIPYVILIGKDEIKQNKIKLRDMKTGKEKLLTVNELILKFKKFLFLKLNNKLS